MLEEFAFAYDDAGAMNQVFEDAILGGERSTKTPFLRTVCSRC